MWNIIENPKNIFIFQLSSFLTTLIVLMTYLLLGPSFVMFVGSSFCTYVIYVILSKNTMFQLWVLLCLRKPCVINSFQQLKKMYPITKPCFHFFFLSFVFFLFFLKVNLKCCFFFYAHDFAKIYLSVVMIPLLGLKSLFYSQIFYHYLDEISSFFYKKKEDEKNSEILNKIDRLRETFN